MTQSHKGRWPAAGKRLLWSAAALFCLFLSACGSTANAPTATSSSATSTVAAPAALTTSSAQHTASSNETTSAQSVATTTAPVTRSSATSSAAAAVASTRALVATTTAAATTTAITTGATGNGITTKLTGTPVPLVVYSAQGYDADMVKAFQAATNIPTKLVDDSTGPLLAKIAAEKNNPQWGLLWVDGDEAFASLDQQGQLLQNFEPPVDWNALGKSVVPKNSSYIPTGLTVAGTVVYNSATVSDPPKTWNDLLLPAWKDVVGMNNPAVSGPTFPFVAGMMVDLGGEQQGKDFFTKLKANGLHVYQTNGDTLHALESGQIKVAMIQSSAGIGADLKTPTIKTTFLSKSALLPSAIGIDAKAPAQEQTEAKMFAEFVLSPAGQQVMLNGDKAGDSLYWPVVSGVNPLPPLPAIATLPTEVVDPYVWGAKEAEINQWFSQQIAQ